MQNDDCLTPEMNSIARRFGAGERCIAWGVAIAALAPFAALLLPGDEVLPYYEWSDYTAYHLPVHEFIRQEFLAVRVPLWIPWLGSGTPLHASQQAGVFYPGLTLPLVLFPANYALKLALFIHLALAYVGQYQLCRALGIGAPAASLGALVVAQSGFMVNHLMAGHVNVAIGAALAPWFLWALARLLAAPCARRAAIAALIGGAFALGSHPQISYYTLLVGTAWTAAWLLFARGWDARRRAIEWLSLAAVAAVLIGAVQIFPSAELVHDAQSGSSRGEEGFAAGYALNGVDLARLIAPNLTRNPLLSSPLLHDNDFFHERVAYLGLGTLALGAYGLTRASAARWQWAVAAAGVVGLAFALGNSTPWFSLLGAITPGLFWFRCPGRVFAVVTPLLALLAARGCGAIINGEPRAEGGRLWRTIAAFALAGSAIAPALGNLGDDFSADTIFHRAWSAGREDVLAAAAFCVLTVASMAFIRRERGRSPGFSAVLVLALMLADLGYSNAASFWLEAPQASEIPHDVLALNPPIRFLDAPNYPYITAVSLHYSRLADTAVRNRRSMVGTDDGGILPAAAVRYYKAIERDPPKALAIGACGYATQRAGPWKKLAGTLPRIRFLANKAAPLCLVPIDELCGDDARMMLDEMAQRSAPASAESNGYDDAGVVILNDEPRRLELRVDAPGAGMLVVADTWYPGWTCVVDGTPAAIDRAHGAFRAVSLTAGNHVVAFEYQPRSFYIGLVGTVAGLLLVALLALRGGVRLSGSFTSKSSPT